MVWQQRPETMAWNLIYSRTGYYKLPPLRSYFGNIFWRRIPCSNYYHWCEFHCILQQLSVVVFCSKNKVILPWIIELQAYCKFHQCLESWSPEPTLAAFCFYELMSSEICCYFAQFAGGGPRMGFSFWTLRKLRFPTFWFYCNRCFFARDQPKN